MAADKKHHVGVCRMDCEVGGKESPGAIGRYGQLQKLEPNAEPKVRSEKARECFDVSKVNDERRK